MMWQKLEARLHERRLADGIRRRMTLDSEQSRHVMVDGARHLNFSSNDYLGLASHPALKETMQHAIHTYGVGSGASHLIVGHQSPHQKLEQSLAQRLGTEAAITFSSGYMANYGVLTALLDKHDAVIQDKLNHASLIDGGKASAACMMRYRHNDMASLNRQLSSDTISRAQSKLIVTDGVFSMDGDIAPLDELVAIKQKNNAYLMVDDAHGFGVLGDAKHNRLGSLAHHGLATTNADIYMATFGKALGGFGAFVAGSQLLIDSLVQFCRSYCYTTAVPAALAATNRHALQLLDSEPWRQEQLAKNIQYFKQQMQSVALELLPSDTAIQPIVLGDSKKALIVSHYLREHKILAMAIRPPTVAEGRARIRVTLTAEHSFADIEQLVTRLSEATQQH